MLTDGRDNYVTVWIDDDCAVLEFTRYAGRGDPSTILAAVAEAFETEIFSEHEPRRDTYTQFVLVAKTQIDLKAKA